MEETNNKPYFRISDIRQLLRAVEPQREGLLLHDASGGIVFANRHIAEWLGYSIEQLQAMQLLQLNQRLNRIELKKRWGQLKAEGPLKYTIKWTNAEGGDVRLEVEARLLAFGDRELCCCLLQRAGKTSEEISAGSSTEDTFGQLAHITLVNSEAMIYWIKPDCSFFFVNQAAYQSLGHSKEELMNMEITDVDAEHTQDQWSDIWSELKVERSTEIESTFIRKNGRVFPVECHLTYLELDGEALISLSARDITRRRQKEARLQSALLEINSLSQQLEAENIYLQEEVSSDYNFEQIITNSENYRKVLKKVEQVASTDATVLIEGETGTGKELLARAIHSLSQRNKQPLIKVNCAALPEHLILSELFGHEKGAFTGAQKQRLGRFELANGGTIFLDEIGELPLEVQAKLLNVLQENEFERVGGTETISVDVRVIAATNRQLAQMAKKGKFREDLFYRLNVFPIENPPLRERREDIPLLARHFIRKFCEKTGKNILQIKPKGLKRLKEYDFPGNVRELMNIIERAVILTNGEVLNLSHWNPSKEPSNPHGEPEHFPTFEEIQRKHLLEALERTKWKVSGPGGAAELLGLNPQTLFSKMRKFGIERPG